MLSHLLFLFVDLQIVDFLPSLQPRSRIPLCSSWTKYRVHLARDGNLNSGDCFTRVDFTLVWIRLRLSLDAQFTIFRNKL